ncbi:MAG TPA: hypothetical protein PLL78_01540 [Fimbriimonadaceae bacterium]|nr:hypothetical protein [Fimbriimonadaceae bacterium]HRJ95342.1 hypothetical protein [Fimbriimonadaceae bacterium]
MINFLPVAFSVLALTTRLDQVVFAFDRPEPKLEARILSCETEESLRELAKQEKLTVIIEGEVTYVSQRDILSIDQALGRAKLIQFLASSSQEARIPKNLNDLPPEHQELIRREIARQAGDRTSMLLRSKSAPFTFEPQLLLEFKRGDRSATVDIGPKSKRSFDDTLGMLVDPTPVPGDKYPIGIGPEQPETSRRASLTFTFADSSGSQEDRLEGIQTFTKILSERVAEATAEYERAANLAMPYLLAEYSDIHLSEKPKSLSDLSDRMKSMARSLIIDGDLLRLGSRADATSFADGARIEGIDYVPSIVFRIKDFYHEGPGSRGVGLTTPIIRLDNPLGKSTRLR